MSHSIYKPLTKEHENIEQTIKSPHRWDIGGLYIKKYVLHIITICFLVNTQFLSAQIIEMEEMWVNKSNDSLLGFEEPMYHKISKNDFLDLISKQPSFGLYKDNYFITGIPLNQQINKYTANAKFQVSISQRLIKTVLPFNSFPMFIYTQKSFWNIYAKSSPLNDNNYNSGLALVKPIIHKDMFRGMTSLALEHESNGRDSLESRAWNYLILMGVCFFDPCFSIKLKFWAGILSSGDPDLEGDGNPDTLYPTGITDTFRVLKRDILQTVGLIVTTNVGVWAFDKYVTKDIHANISPKSIIKNIKTGYVWDTGKFSTNLLAHPYHGGLYFNAARSNGLNFWQSVPYVAGGSLMWEFCMEDNPAAINDYVSTTIGGVCLGELTFRISDLLIDNRTVGFDRFKREALLALISPIHGLNRILNGEVKRHSNVRGNSIRSTSTTFYSMIGHRIIADNTQKEQDIGNMLCYDLGLTYGDTFDKDNDNPYDFFTFKLSGNLISQQPVVSRVSVLGMIFSKTINLQKPNRQMILGVFQHFNFHQSNAEINNVTLRPFKMSEAASVGPGIMYKNKIRKNISFSSSAHLSCILLGGSQTDYYKYDYRDYNLGSGFSSKLNFELEFKNKFNVSFNLADYRIYTWQGYDPADIENFSSNAQGDISDASLSEAKINLNYIINKHFVISSEIIYYYRRTNYKYYTNVEHNVYENKLSVGYIF